MSIADELNDVIAETRLVDIAEVHATFRRWLGEGYDPDALDIVLAAATVERLDGDRAAADRRWCPCDLHDHIRRRAAVCDVETGDHQGRHWRTSSKHRRPWAAGDQGLHLHTFGEQGHAGSGARRTPRGLRRQMDPQRRHRWRENADLAGRIVVIGAVTSEYDRHHAVITAMG